MYSTTAAFECGIRNAECGMRCACAHSCSAFHVLYSPLGKMVGTAGLGFPSLTRWVPKVGLFASRIVIHLRPPGPKPGALNTELLSDKMADTQRPAPSTFPP